MSFASILATVFGKRPVWLYRFTRGPSEAFFTSRNESYSEPITDVFDTPDVFNDDVDVFTRTWEGIALSQSRIRDTSVMGRAECDITFPQTSTWAQSYLSDNGYANNDVHIFQLFANDGDLEKRRRFVGRVVGTKPTLTRISLVCENRFTEGRYKALAAVIQRPCRHALYNQQGGLGCGAALADFQVSATASGITGNACTVAAASSQADGYYSGGILSWNGRLQLITKHVGTTLTLLGPIDGFAAAVGGSNQDVLIAPGCDLSRSTCFNRFNALDNFGGFPWADETPYDGKALF
jgi:uncharacterized phage protein (TIGR02218 family)